MADMVAFGRRTVTTEENFAAGHRACIGCAEALAVRLACKALGKNIIIAMATGCMEIVSSPLPWTSWRVPWIHTLFDNTAAVAAGIEAGLKIKEMKGRGSEKKIHVVAMGGDGATADIGLQALSGALERGHDMLYICLDNEGYMNTGIQRSSATPYGASTTTAPVGKHSIGQTTWKKNMPAIVAAHGIPYVATACPAYPFDLMDKVKKGAEIEGPAYVHILSPCPIGWRCPPEKSVYAGRLAVQTGVFPLYEIEDGKYKLNYTPLKLKPIEEYLKLQGRYKHLTAETIKIIQERVEKENTELKHRVDSQKPVS